MLYNIDASNHSFYFSFQHLKQNITNAQENQQISNYYNENMIEEHTSEIRFHFCGKLVICFHRFVEYELKK